MVFARQLKIVCTTRLFQKARKTLHTIPLILELSKNLTEYVEFVADHRTFTTLLNASFPAYRLEGHKAACNNDETTQLGYHGSYMRKCIIDTEGIRHQAQLHRVYCPKCRRTWSIYPSIILPHKRHDSYAVQNLLEATLSHEMSYRGAIRQQQQLTSSGQSRPNPLRDHRTP